jgi:tRNA modification GTPase
VTLLDTAGIRDSDDPVEREGVRRALKRATEADLVLWVTDASATGIVPGDDQKTSFGSAAWTVINKADLLVDKLWINCESQSGPLERTFSISATTGAGIERLLKALSAYAQDYFSAAETSLVTRSRHRQALEQTVSAIDRALAQGASGSEELIAEELRAAATTLGRLTGRVDVEDILDVIFRDFCIGK